MKKRYARILAATLSVAMVFTSAPTGFVGINTGVIEAEAADASNVADIRNAVNKALTDSTVTSLLAIPHDGSTTATVAATNIVNQIKTIAATDSGNGSDLTIKAIGSGTTVSVVGGGSTAPGSYTATVNFQSGTVDYPTTINFEILAATSEDVDGLFPTTIKKVFGSSSGEIVVTGTGNGATTKSALESALALDADVASATVTGMANIDTMRAGDTCDVTIKLTMEATAAPKYAVFDDDADHTTVTITRVFSLECTKSATPTVAATPAAVKVTAEYGTGVVKLADDVTAWTVVPGTASAAVKTTNAYTGVGSGTASSVSEGVTIQTVAQYNEADYDMDTYVTNNPGYVYNKTTKRIEKKVAVKIVPAEIKLSSVKWPTGLAKEAYVGDDLSASSVKFTGDYSKEGTFAVSSITAKGYNGEADGSAGVTANRAGEQTVTMTYTIPKVTGESNAAYGNYVLVDDMESTVVSTSNAYTATNTKTFKTTVAKKTISDADIALKYIKKEVEYGATYAEMQSACLNITNSYVTYELKDSTLASKVMPQGAQKVAYVAKIKDALKFGSTLSSGRTQVTIYADINVKAPTAAAKVGASGATAGIAATEAAYKAQAAQADIAGQIGVTSDVTAKAVCYVGSYLASHSTEYDALYQWYKDGAEISGATANSYVVPVENASAAGVSEYYCVVTLKAKDNASADTKAILAAVVPGGTITTNKITNTVSNIATAIVGGSSNLATDGTYAYGYKSTIKLTAKATYNGTGFETTSVSAWVVEDGKTDKIEIANPLKDIAANGDVTVTAPVPSGLNAGDYHVFIQFNGVKTADKTKTDIALFSAALKINKKALNFTSVGDIKTVETSYPYGTATSEIVVTSEQAKDYGTYVISSELPTYLPAASGAVARTVTFTPAAGIEDNYTITAETSVNVTIDKAKLTFTPNDVEIKLGEKLPTIDPTAFTVKGVAAKDRYEELGINKVEMHYIAGAENLISKVGKVEEAIEIVVTAPVLDNYTIVEVPANIVVTDGTEVKPSTAPTVAPTVAPTKAPAVKAAKATVSVKAGKSVALKLKNAPKGAKVTWSLDKKAKKALKVSKKGKVTVKKGAKKGTYKVYAKVNGKKVTFKVKVK